MEIRIAGIEPESIVDGPGLRYVIFSQGCTHNCHGCHNPETHSFLGGTVDETSRIVDEILENPLLSGVTFSGGDPFSQPEPFIDIAERLKGKGLGIWCYTGYTMEELMEKGTGAQRNLLAHIDTLVDGRFILSRRTLSIPFVGSSNQRVLNLTGMDILSGSKDELDGKAV
ncbi:anaerobic ribonucleoside-triphosphate reductase activating protein [Youngiibacter fragilis]|uniref:Anaerobic ribonucleoside-triphosphate reductase-activating protein n=1 Tax=Youngiibacter fragilis 232.1 TaxID=994573 RepID=V7I2Y2_9CLOT|nr:anaerobic ribonucleoside-triphosphate reductase activating protein [Youngiibacter fragilis]ETA79626.1 ribonucleoside-triphosphate reductase activating protein [Youngiibacter fragilis 232.1]